MAQAAQATGHGLSVEFDGRKYEIAHLDPDMLGMFEVWLEDQAFKKVERTRGRVPPEVYKERLDVVGGKVSSFQYAVGTENFEAAWRSPGGQKYIFFLRLAKKNPDIDEDFANRLWDTKYQEILARLSAMEATGEDDGGGDDPNGEAPAA
jgi:hypothetical protein